MVLSKIEPTKAYLGEKVSGHHSGLCVLTPFFFS